MYYFQRAQTEAVTFLGHQDSARSLYAIPGLDYVAHDDILPYTASETSTQPPLQHELFDKFLAPVPNRGKKITLINIEQIYDNLEQKAKIILNI